MANKKIKVSDLPVVGNIINFVVFGYDAVTGKSAKATMDQLRGNKGDRGDAFKYEDFTPEQLAALKGDKGDAFRYEDFTPAQLAALKGDRGEAFKYSDFTPEQLEALRGPRGYTGKTAYESAQSGGFAGTEAEYNISMASLGNLNDVLDAING